MSNYTLVLNTAKIKMIIEALEAVSPSGRASRYFNLAVILSELTKVEGDPEQIAKLQIIAYKEVMACEDLTPLRSIH